MISLPTEQGYPVEHATTCQYQYPDPAGIRCTDDFDKAVCAECGQPLEGESTSPDGGATWLHYECE